MAQLLHRLGAWCARRRFTVLGAWVVLVALFGIGAATLSGATDDSFSIPGTESQQALDLLEQKFPGTGGATARVVVAAPKGHKITEKTYADLAERAFIEVAKSPEVINVAGSKQQLSADGRIGFVDVQYAVPVDEISDQARTNLAKLVEPMRAAGLQVEFSGGVVSTTEAHGNTAEVIGIVIGFFVLAITFGALMAAGMPLLSAIIGVAIGLMGITTVTGFVELSSTTPALAMMLGLAVGIDYALFIISRHRTQVASGMPVTESIALATGTAGGAVVFAGVTVIVALASLSVVGIPFLTAMGLAAAATVAVAVLVSITFVPAILAVLGHRLEKGRIPFITPVSGTPDGVTNDTDTNDSGTNDSGTNDSGTNDSGKAIPFGERWARMVTARPWVTILMCIAGTCALALPVLDINLGLPDDSSKSTQTTERRAYDLLTDGFGPGFNGPLTFVVSTPGNNVAAQLAATAQEEIAKSDRVVAVSPPVPNEAGDIALLSITPSSAPSSQETQDLVAGFRDYRDDVRAQTNADIYVTGQTAMNIDVSDKLADALPVFLVLIVVLALILLTLVFRSILVPLKAVVGFLLSLGASMGVTVAVFQQGHLSSLFGVENPGPVVSFLPVLLIGILFGLAMDYEVFLVSRIREDYTHSRDARGSIISGMRHSARVVTAAALIMLAVFGAFVLGDDPIIKALGLALAVGVAVDAVVVRMSLVPAVLHLIGERAWSLPRWLDRILPDLDIEGTKLTESRGVR